MSDNQEHEKRDGRWRVPVRASLLLAAAGMLAVVYVDGTQPSATAPVLQDESDQVAALRMEASLTSRAAERPPLSVTVPASAEYEIASTVDLAAAPAAPSPSSGAVTETSAEFGWDEVRGAASYDGQIKKGGEWEPLFSEQESLGVTVEGKPGSTVTIRARANSEAATSSWSDPVSATLPVPEPEPEPEPASTSPSQPRAASSGDAPSGGDSSTPSSGSASVSDIKAYASAKVGGGEQFSCLDRLWQRESNWNHTAQNPSSGAYGIPQSLPGSKMASAGSDWQTNPYTQVDWGVSYIEGRYGTPCEAWAHSEANNWY